MKWVLIICLSVWAAVFPCRAQHRQWTAADGLPTGEVHQLIPLPNGQMLVNCEGVFCISNGSGFDVVPCESTQAHRLDEYASHYCHLWQGDSLLWLRDFYRLYLFDAHRRTFRPDILPMLTDGIQHTIATSQPEASVITGRQQAVIDSLGIARIATCAASDWQGGLWIGTRTDGIVYLPPRKRPAQLVDGNNGLVGIARSTTDDDGRLWRCRADGLECEADGQTVAYNKDNVSGLPFNRTTFIQQLPDGRYLLCDSLSTLGYFIPERRQWVSLSDRLPELKKYRHFVGACPIDRQWTVVYAQNGIFRLDTQADTLAAFAPAAAIEQFATKYNCMVKGPDGRLWIGTQNGLFCVDDGVTTRMVGLLNNCIRSLAADQRGNIWASTSRGISRITPSVINLGKEDGIPEAAMMERAVCLTDDGQLAFVVNSASAVVFHPDSVIHSGRSLPVVITACKVNGVACTPHESMVLTHRENYLELSFSDLDYATPSHCHYRYRLYPMEKSWNTDADHTSPGRAAYTALPPGKYRFEVQAVGPDGQWGDTTSVAITILPPWWATWWAKTLYALLAIALFALLTHLYLKRRRQQMERKNDERVNQLFELRDEARHQFAQSVSIDPSKITANKTEEELVDKMLKAIEQNMDNLSYTVDQLAADIGMSRANLYKKTQLMLGITPNDFLKNVRLKHAARLLTETNEPVNQISLLVGFQTSRYFSQCFRQLFGMTPTEYRSGK